MIKFTDALRLGAMLGQQLFGVVLNDEKGSCALGAAILGAGLPIFQASARSIRGGVVTGGTVAIPAEWRQLLDLVVACPACAKPTESILLHLAHLNDTHRWTRQQIADWVAPFEEALAAPTATLIEQKQEVSQ